MNRVNIYKENRINQNRQEQKDNKIGKKTAFRVIKK